MQIDEDLLQLDLTEGELCVLPSGINEALQELEDWEFSTYMGVDRDMARRVLRHFGQLAYR